MTVYNPDTIPYRSPRLSKQERLWLESRRSEAERASIEKASRALPGRMQRLVDRWGVEAGWVASGLEGATVTRPPSAENTGSTRRSSGPSDPTGRTLDAVLAETARAASLWAHLTGRCAADGTVNPETDRMHVCPDGGLDELADRYGLTLPNAVEVIDGLSGTPSSSTQAFSEVVARAAGWHTVVASRWGGWFLEQWQAGQEPSVLETWVADTDRWVRRLTGLAGSLAEWSGRGERTCKADGCDAAVPIKAGSMDRGGATCDRCRQRKSRHLRAVS